MSIINELLKYLENDDLNIRWQYYEAGAYNNMIHGTYSMLRSLLYKGADTLTFTQTECQWSKEGKVLYFFRLDQSLSAAKYYTDALNTILTRDPIVRERVHLASQDENSTVYKIDLPPD